MTDLMLLARNGTLSSRLLAGVQGQLRQQDFLGRTALIHAVLARRVGCAALLAPHEAGSADSDGTTAYHHALETGQRGLAAAIEKACANQLLLAVLSHKEVGPYLFCAREVNAESGRTALMAAAATQDIKACALLYNYEKGVQNRQGHTALMHAACENALEAVQLLVVAEQKMTDCHGNCALHYLLDHVRDFAAAGKLLAVEAGIRDIFGLDSFDRLLANGMAKKCFYECPELWASIMQKECSTQGVLRVKRLIDK